MTAPRSIPPGLIDAERALSLARSAVNIARDAGNAIMQIYAQSDLGIESKSDNSPLTAADKAAHQIIVTALRQLTPDIPMISEEASQQYAFELRSCWKTYWLIDPLDGTKEFIKRNGEFTVNIALIQNGEPIIGVVYVPVSDITYWAAATSGAFKQSGTAEPTKIDVRHSARSPLKVAGSRSHRSEELESYLKQLGDIEEVPMGSSLKFCLVAEGAADIYPRIGPTSEWDTAAAQCVVEQAGGHVTDLEGKPLRYNSKDSLLNPYFLVFGDSSRDWLPK